MSGHPLVSLFVICYNHERFVIDALESARNQTYPNIELIILDDCSTDNSVAVIENWIVTKQVQCTFIKHEENLGVVKSLNECLRLSTGAYISFFAADDWIAPEKTSVLLELLLGSPVDVCLVYGDLKVIDEFGDVTYPSFYKWYLQGMTPPSGYVFDYYFDRNLVHILGAVVRRSAYDAVGLYDESLIYEDWDMGMRMARAFKFKYHPGVVGAYRKFSGQMTDVYWRDKEKHKRILSSDFKMFSKHLDRVDHRKKLLGKLSDIYKNQIQKDFLSWNEKIKGSFLLLDNDSKNFARWALFLGSIINQTSLVYSIFRKYSH